MLKTKLYIKCRSRIVFLILLLILSIVFFVDNVYSSTRFPRLFGMNIGNKNYDELNYQKDLAKLDGVVLGFFPGWLNRKGPDIMRETVLSLKKINPNLKIGQYTILNETYDPSDQRYADKDKGLKVEKMNWWLRDENGKRVQWIKDYDCYDINITRWVKKDHNGFRYPEWLAHRDYKIYFNKIPELDIWYLDNALSKPPSQYADWDLDGKNDRNDDPKIQKEYRLGNLAHWEEIKKLAPQIKLVGNSDDITSEEYRKKLNGVFLEALIGKKWSQEHLYGWEYMMKKYYMSIENTIDPKIVVFNVWGKRNDYQRMRYALTSCLLNDGYFSYTDEEHGYSTVPWFDEFDIDLGFPEEKPIEIEGPEKIYKRRFTKGLIIVNPGKYDKEVYIEEGYKHFIGKQDKKINSGEKANKIQIKSRDGVILIKNE